MFARPPRRYGLPKSNPVIAGTHKLNFKETFIVFPKRKAGL
jgi:hypothetical protein